MPSARRWRRTARSSSPAAWAPRADVVQDAHPHGAGGDRPACRRRSDAAPCTRICRKPHDPYTDLVPPQGIRLTPRHYAYLKISEGCNHRCTFCIIPSLRGDLVSRPVGEVMQEAENLVKAGVKELLVISQDTSAYGVDVKYRTGFWDGRPLKTRMTELVQALGRTGRRGCACITSIPIRTWTKSFR